MSLFKRFSIKQQNGGAPRANEDNAAPDLQSFSPGALIPPEVLQKHIDQQNSDKSFEALRLKVQKTDEEARRKEEIAKLISERQGRLQDPGTNHQLGQLHFKLLYDVGREALRVTLIEASHLRPRDPVGVVLNVRVSVTLESTRGIPNTIKPRPKLSMLNKLAQNRGTDFSASVGQKTETVDPASTSIYWRTHKPVWNEDFLFEGIQNRQLKRLAVVFSVFEKHPAKPPEPPKDEFIGECRIPLVKIHKRIGGLVTNSRTNIPRIAIQQNSAEYANPYEPNEYANVDGGANEKEKTPEAAVEIPLPTSNIPVVYKSIVKNWLDEKYEDPTPGEDGEMEELASLCNSEAVREELDDPELMDCISVRELRLATNQASAQLQALKDLTMNPEPENSQQAEDVVDNIDFIDSETELSERSRPCVIRTLEGWHYINQVPSLRPIYGELEVALHYEPNLGRITVSIIKGIKIVGPNGAPLTVSVSVQKKTRTFKKATPLSVVTQSGSKRRPGRVGGGSGDSGRGAIEIVEKAGHLRRTGVRTDTANPVWDNRFEFNVSKELLQSVCFDVLVYDNNAVVGGLRLGHIAPSRASNHWFNMVKKPGLWLSKRYILQ